MNNKPLRKVKYSIRTKLLFFVLALLSLSLGFYLLIAIDLFKADKKAYIFDAQAAYAQTTSLVFENEILGIIKQAQLIHNLSIQNKSTSEFLNSEKLIHVASFKNNSKFHYHFSKNTSSKFDQSKVSSLIGNMKDKLMYLSFNYFSEGNSLIILKVRNDDYLLVLFESNKLLKQIKDQSFGSIILLDSENKNVLAKEGQRNDLTKKFAVMKFPGQTGAKEVLVDSEPTLLSYHSLLQDNFKLIITTPTAKTFELANFLIKKTGLIAVFIFSLAGILIVMLSNRLTVPLANLVQTINFVSEGRYDIEVEVKSNDEIGVMADHFNLMSRKIADYIDKLKSANIQLEDYSKNLEKMVEKRTEELFRSNQFLDAMINSLDEGLFVFDKDNIINDKTTKSCDEIFGENIAGKNVFDILKITGDDRAVMNDWSQILFSGALPFDHAMELCVKEIQNGNSPKDPDYQFVEMSYYPMYDANKKLENVVVVATDKTIEKKLKQEQAEQESLAEMILKIAQSKKQFTSFAVKCNENLTKAVDTISANPKEYTDLKINLHSLRGSTGIFGLLNINKMLYEIEKLIVESEKKDEPLDHLRVDILNVQEVLYEIMENIAKPILGKNPLKEGANESGQKNLEFRQLLLHKSQTELCDKFDELFLKVPVSDFFYGINDMLKGLAKDLDKQIYDLDFVGTSIRVFPEKVAPFFDNLVHVFRNAIFHGIETPQERQKQGKDSSGKIKVTSSLADNNKVLVIEVEDDGRGINFEKLGINVDEINKIFDPNVSSSDDHNAVAGLGVGLSAIADILKKIGGRYHIDSQINKGCHFKFEIPLS